jgi:hypothetical protein
VAPSKRRKLLWRRGVVVAVALIVGGTGGLGFALAASSSYTAHTTVFVTRGLPDVAGGDVNTAVADFETALRLPEVDAAVGDQVHIAASSIRDGITISRVLSSAAIRVSFSSAQRSVASAVVVQASHQALIALAQQGSQAAAAALSVAQNTYQDARNRLLAFDRSVGVADVDAEYAAHTANLANLRNALLLSGSPALASVVASETTLVNKLAAAEPEYQTLKAASDSAAGAVASAAQSVADASGILASASSPTILTPPVVGRTSSGARLAQATVLAGVAAAVVVALTIALLEWRGRRRDSSIMVDLRSPRGVGLQGADRPAPKRAGGQVSRLASRRTPVARSRAQ